MSDLGDRRAALVTRLVDAELRATLDPRDVNPPCILVGLAQGSRVTGCAYEGTVDVTVIAPGAGHADAAAWLDDTTSTVAQLLTAASWSPDTYPMAVGDRTVNLLAYTLTVPIAWSVTP